MLPPSHSAAQGVFCWFASAEAVVLAHELTERERLMELVVLALRGLCWTTSQGLEEHLDPPIAPALFGRCDDFSFVCPCANAALDVPETEALLGLARGRFGGSLEDVHTDVLLGLAAG